VPRSTTLLDALRDRVRRWRRARSPVQPTAAATPAATRLRSPAVTFFHDIEQNFDCDVDPASCRRAVEAMLAIEAKHGIRATYNVVGRLAEREPELLERIAAGGHEIAAHSFTHDPNWNPTLYAGEVLACRAASTTIKGYRSPRSQWDGSTLDALWSNGFLWNAEADRSSDPYFVHKGLVRLPIGADDWSLLTGKATVDEWSARFAGLAAERRFFGWGSHDCVVAARGDETLGAYDRIVAGALERGLRVLTFGQAAEELRNVALAEHYSSTASAWNGGTRHLYRTRRFQELVRSEAQAMGGAPAVADLGSAGGILSLPLRDVAQHIWCVDSAPGMLADLPPSANVTGVLGDVADSTLPAASADLVICARVLEYLYDPDRAAGEIRRIAKDGAVVFATFPADRGTPPRNEGKAPDRLRRHFTREQVLAWGRHLGEGHVLGVQYDEREPSGPAQESEYRQVEDAQPADRLPTNWVFIGRVDR
jgi:peptidoglycan/xylan/chitin deacetylase (PgdA/CDA1 family)/SAM-dependent methyltransferase